jgi:hypothetical protein
MVRPVEAGGAALSYLQQDPPPQLDPVKDAKHILETGDRSFRKDDYDARLVELGKQLNQGDSLYREQLMSEIFKQDPGALRSWLTPERANNLQHSGRISMVEKGNIAESLAAAYNHGDIPSYQRGAGPTPGSGEDGKINGYTDLDELVTSFDNHGGGDHDKQVRSSDDVAQFLEFMNSSNGGEATKFRQTFSQHLIDEYVLNPAVKYNNLETQQVAGTLAGNLLGAPPEGGSKNLATEVLGAQKGNERKYSDEQIQTIIDAAAKGGRYLNHDNVNVVDDDDQNTINSVHVSDGASLLIQSVANTHTTKAGDVATSLARLPANDPDLFKGSEGKGHVWAMGNLFASHSKPILDKLTDYSTHQAKSKDDPYLKEYMQNASELGSLFNVVLFKSDQPYSAQARQNVLDYAADLKQSINTEKGSSEAMDRLAMLSGAADDAITQGFTELKADEEARKEMVTFFADLAIAGIPFDKVKDKAETMIGELFKNPHVADALKTVTGDIVDQGTGKLTDEAKNKLIEQLGKDEAELLDQQGASDALRDSLLSGIEDERDFNAVKNNAEDVTQGINIWKK